MNWEQMKMLPLFEKQHAVHAKFVSMAKKPWKLYGEEDKKFCALSLCGEAGEVANLVKKQWRGDEDPRYLKKLAKELADVQIFTILLCRAHDIDLGKAMDGKLNEVINRLRRREAKKTGRLAARRIGK